MDGSESTATTHGPALAALLTRHSLGPRWMVEPGPTAEQLALAVRAALRAPDHGSLRPWRIAVVAPEQRAALAERFSAGTLDVGTVFQFLAYEVVVVHMLGSDREYIPYVQSGAPA